MALFLKAEEMANKSYSESQIVQELDYDPKPRGKNILINKDFYFYFYNVNVFYRKWTTETNRPFN